MSPVLASALWGVVAALPLLAGAWYALRFHPSKRAVGLVAAFGAGALISAVSFELVLDAVGVAPPTWLAAALAAGAIVYYLGDRTLDRRSASGGSGGRGLALMMGAVLDGVPESFILGMTFAVSGQVGIAFLIAVILSNLPEGMASAAELGDDPDMPPNRILGMWAIVIAASAAAAAIGSLAADLPKATGAVAQAFAAGALLTMLVDDLVPEAREEGGIAAGLVAVMGFAVAFALSQLGA